ncbi:protein GYG-1, isoform c [Basidiobolus meristosporus CBS 931.73]|uniref:glycogenin glucosyltransferase n=1 Tax=Basidiobolus meristosporus CBS 931.73 TaxID=1314790 RepID=A0A1Y1Y7K7_9FUNG|nr:protein GYG-1, isoform c [Basidiobolus meristosporus CBS 931.73]|eukprot:ORX93885.1 protein GYG-1, isoform c [Basidiobolus meristosporus CBS 931.73]
MDAYVTLVTNDAYFLGARVLAQSLREASTSKKIVCLYTPTVTLPVQKEMSIFFDELVLVDPIDSQDAKNLKVLGRGELGITFTKLHTWRLTQYRKVVFLDADTLPLRNVDELFELEAEFSACPDAGWPDCFNSGVFVCSPSQKTYDELIQLASTEGSFDGGDQGLLNVYFTNWSRMPFTYNVTPNAFYSYAPAYRYFRKSISIVHFIGSHKPWGLRRFQDGTPMLLGNVNEEYVSLVSKWWATFDRSKEYLLENSITEDSTEQEHLPPPPSPEPIASRSSGLSTTKGKYLMDFAWLRKS